MLMTSIVVQCIEIALLMIIIAECIGIALLMISVVVQCNRCNALKLNWAIP